MLLQFLPELRSHIVTFLTGADLKNLACCNASYNKTFQPFLWRCIVLSYSELRKPLSQTQLELLAHTKKISITSGDTDLLGNGVLDSKLIDELIRSMNVNFNLLMMNCTSNTQTLHVCRHPALSTDVLTSISNLTGLQELNLHNDDACGHYNPCWFRNADEHQNLKVNGKMSEVTLTAICVLPLKKLQISWNGEVGDDWLEHLSSMTSLTDLDIAHYISPHNPVTNQGIKHISSLIHLRVLNVSFTHFTDDGMHHINNLDNLGTLVAVCCAIRGASLGCLSNLKHLQNLNLNYNPITDAQLKNFRSLRFLKDLNLSTCRGFTDAGLSDLSGLTWLKDLDVCETSITDQGAEWLKSALPNVKIEHYYFSLSDDYVDSDESDDGHEICFGFAHDSDDDYVEDLDDYYVF